MDIGENLNRLVLGNWATVSFGPRMYGLLNQFLRHPLNAQRSRCVSCFFIAMTEVVFQRHAPCWGGEDRGKVLAIGKPNDYSNDAPDALSYHC